MADCYDYAKLRCQREANQPTMMLAATAKPTSREEVKHERVFGHLAALFGCMIHLAPSTPQARKGFAVHGKITGRELRNRAGIAVAVAVFLWFRNHNAAAGVLLFTEIRRSERGLSVVTSLGGARSCCVPMASCRYGKTRWVREQLASGALLRRVSLRLQQSTPLSRSTRKTLTLTNLDVLMLLVRALFLRRRYRR